MAVPKFSFIFPYMKQERRYEPPQCAVEAVQATELLCTSPKEGGIEDVGYEDWVREG